MLKKISKIIVSLFVLLLFGIFLANYRIDTFAEGKLYENVTDIPHNKIGLLLGTSKYISSGNLNLYYRFRIDAAVKLYHSKKIDYILVSGDNGNKNYNEPKSIKEDLIKGGIPENKIVLDYAGFRTLDSVVRASKVFEEEEFTVISQPFHNKRAVYLASRFKCKAIGFNAQQVGKRYGIKVQLREYLARFKVFLDLWFGVEPKFLGEKIKIG